jgi:hypothetical protein
MQEGRLNGLAQLHIHTEFTNPSVGEGGFIDNVLEEFFKTNRRFSL